MNIKTLFAGILSMTAILACQEEIPVVQVLNLEKETIKLSSTEAWATFKVTSNKAWTAEADMEWVTLDPSIGNGSDDPIRVRITAADNETAEERISVITVRSGELEKTVTLTQIANPNAEPEPEDPEQPAEPEEPGEPEQPAEPEEPEQPEEPTEDGTEAKPYKIENLEDLLAVRTLAVLDGTTYFSLETDIDMSTVSDWVPINYDEKFTRQIHFEGNNHVISNFTTATTYNYSSFFGVLYGSLKNIKFVNAKVTSDGATGCGVIGGYIGTTNKPAVVENVTIEGVTVNAGNALNIGGLAGQMVGSELKNCTITGLVLNGGSNPAEILVYYGGLVGQVKGEGSTIYNCHVEGTINSEATTSLSYIGGLIGRIGDTAENTHTISYCSADVTNNMTCAYSGGLLGGIYRSPVTVEKCSAAGSIKGGNNIGGIVGYSEYGTIRDCYTTASITSSGQGCGGIIGTSYNYSGGTDTYNIVERCYSTGSITTSRGGGGIVGINTAKNITISDCIAWNESISASTTNAVHYYTGAIRGGATQNNVCEDCWRRADLSFSTKVEANSLSDSDNVNGTSTAKTAYHGKAAAADATLSSVAKSLGWSEDVWDMTGDVPVLK